MGAEYFKLHYTTSPQSLRWFFAALDHSGDDPAMNADLGVLAHVTAVEDCPQVLPRLARDFL
jgi:hypothetical protein